MARRGEGMFGLSEVWVKAEDDVVGLSRLEEEDRRWEAEAKALWEEEEERRVDAAGPEVEELGLSLLELARGAVTCRELAEVETEEGLEVEVVEDR
jgi:hypothetical protein